MRLLADAGLSTREACGNTVRNVAACPVPGADYAELSQRLLESGLQAALPCVIVSSATGSSQDVRWSNVGRLASEEKLPALALLIVGRVASRDLEEFRTSFWDRDGKNLNRPDVSII
jgi:precorrin-4 methylase